MIQGEGLRLQLPMPADGPSKLYLHADDTEIILHKAGSRVDEILSARGEINRVPLALAKTSFALWRSQGLCAWVLLSPSGFFCFPEFHLEF